jgi:2,5-dihydroxypyridine 5,6-dioxygenase
MTTDIDGGTVARNVAFSNNLLKGARNLAFNCGGVTEGMNVLILNLINDPVCPVDDDVVHALATVCQEVGAHPQILYGTGMEKEWWDDPNPIILGAFRAADLVINNAGSIGRPLRVVRDMMFREGIPMIRNMATSTGSLSSPWALFPFELSEEIIFRAGSRVDAATSWRVTSPNGTDISGTYAPPSGSQSGMGKYATRRRSTKNRPFPQGCLTPMTSVGANGVIVSDRTIPREARHLGVDPFQWSEPVRFTYENNRLTHLEGGFEADVLRDFFTTTQGHIGELAWNLSSFHAGINPKARLNASPAAEPELAHRFVHNNPNCLHFHLGGSKEVEEFDYPYMVHISVEVEESTFYLDGEVFYDKGHFTVLDEPEIRELAAKYGDPDHLLRVEALPRFAQ